tara:strand:+ start:701 stop:1312 length:612 start_codon:yes stop_codon:yes gene_type:complete
MKASEPDKTKEAEYDVLIRIKKGKYYLQIRELSIFSTGSDLSETYNDLILKKKQRFDEYKEHGLLKELPQPRRNLTTNTNNEYIGLKSYMLFIVKSFGIAIIISLCLVLFVPLVISNVAGTVTNEAVWASSRIKNQFGDLFSIKPGRKIEKEIYRAAEKPIPPEKKEKIIKSIRKIVSYYKPVVDEVKLLFTEKTGTNNKLSR